MKLRNKLILSCAALAAVATTAFSTTFAWYTANDTVKATGITGQTSQTDSTLLLISKYGKVGSWGAAVEIDSSAVTLEPVAYNETDDAYYPWVANENEVDDTAVTGGLTSSDKYISFYLYFKSGSSSSLDVQIQSFTLTNTDAAALPTFSVLADGTGVTDASYSVNMFRALDVAITVEQGTEVARAADSPEVTSAGTRTAYNCDTLATGDNIAVASANAHTYYNNVKSLTGADAIDTTEAASETTYTDIATLNSGTFTFATPTGAGAQAAAGNLDSILMVKFDIYLDGWDKMCFDAVRKQHFTLAMEFQGSTHA